MSLTQLSAILEASSRPFFADFAGTPFIQLYLYAHRVEGLNPGVYRHWPESAELEQIRMVTSASPLRDSASGRNLRVMHA